MAEQAEATEEIVEAVPKKRYVYLHAWYTNAKRTRTFILVEKSGHYIPPHGYVTQQVTLIEHLTFAPIYIKIDDFWQQIDDGRLIEYKPQDKTTSAETK